MVIGRTHERRGAAEQARIRRLMLGVRRFRVLARLFDGRLVALQRVWEYTTVGEYDDGSLFVWYDFRGGSAVRRSLEPDPSLVRVLRQTASGCWV